VILQIQSDYNDDPTRQELAISAIRLSSNCLKKLAQSWHWSRFTMEELDDAIDLDLF
jgi:hypothetical protein